MKLFVLFVELIQKIKAGLQYPNSSTSCHPLARKCRLKKFTTFFSKWMSRVVEYHSVLYEILSQHLQQNLAITVSQITVLIHETNEDNQIINFELWKWHIFVIGGYNTVNGYFCFAVLFRLNGLTISVLFSNLYLHSPLLSFNKCNRIRNMNGNANDWNIRYVNFHF